MKITIRNNEISLSLEILQEVAKWLIDNNMEMWELSTLTQENLVTDLTKDGIYVIFIEDEPAGTFVLQWEDPLYWEEIPADVSGFIHKLAIRREFAGQNLFAHVLEFCKQECLKRNIHELRLDTDFQRPKLMQFYENHGFQQVRRKQIHEFGQDFDCMLYELTFLKS